MTVIAPPYVRTSRAVIHRIPLLRLTRVELRKMFNTRSGFWLLASIVIATVLATVAVIVFAPDGELTYSTYIQAIRLPIAVILPIIAILSVTSEWSQRTGLTTFTLVPHRRRIIAAKAISSVTVGVLAVLLALAIGALGNLAGAAATGTALVWDASPLECLHFVLGSILSLMIGFMLGVLIRASIGAIVAYFIYQFVLPSVLGLLATSRNWFQDLQPWIDLQYAQSSLFLFDGPLTGQQWANIGVTGVIWLLIPLVIGLRYVVRSEVK
ncbi:MAG TPA: ABC transporter permease subunit [Dehalococcoidia bacterium]|nr:ABC transporter permease subunit [Dehalococcoidia bacterium]